MRSCTETQCRKKLRELTRTRSLTRERGLKWGKGSKWVEWRPSISTALMAVLLSMGCGCDTKSPGTGCQWETMPIPLAMVPRGKTAAMALSRAKIRQELLEALVKRSVSVSRARFFFF